MTGSMQRFLTVTAVSAMLITFGACNLKVEKDDKGGEKRVDIQTPMGNLNVRNDNVNVKDTGLAVYPGAQVKVKGDHNEDSKANVNIDTPFFGLKVVALTYTTQDDSAKVLGWYRDQMKGFGRFVECKGPSHGDKGSHHKDDLNKPVECDSAVGVNGQGSTANVIEADGKSTELKAGTNGNQHIVSVKPVDNGTEFSLVYVKVHGGKEDSI
jgi:hypothetical protein